MSAFFITTVYCILFKFLIAFLSSTVMFVLIFSGFLRIVFHSSSTASRYFSKALFVEGPGSKSLFSLKGCVLDFGKFRKYSFSLTLLLKSSMLLSLIGPTGVGIKDKPLFRIFSSVGFRSMLPTLKSWDMLSPTILVLLVLLFECLFRSTPLLAEPQRGSWQYVWFIT